MIDTNILICYLKNRSPSVATRIDALDDEDLLRMSVVAPREVGFDYGGIHTSRDDRTGVLDGRVARPKSRGEPLRHFS